METEEAPAFNFLIRVLTPTVFIIIVSAIFYSIHLDAFIKNIYFVSVYYVVFRSVFNIVINRGSLINWPKQIFYYIFIIALADFTYVKFIQTKSNLLPDFNNISNELWIIIVVFVYNTINNISITDKKKAKRKDKYLEIQFASINRKYSPIILKETNNLRLRQIAMAIIIYENFNRPKFFRIIEYVNHFLNRRPHTLGIMQFKTIEFISDSESVKLGTKKLISDFNDLTKEIANGLHGLGMTEYDDDYYQRELIERFNPDLIYSYEVFDLANDINRKYFNNAPTNLFRPQNTI
jgi:hypothetical protein